MSWKETKRRISALIFNIIEISYNPVLMADQPDILQKCKVIMHAAKR